MAVEGGQVLYQRNGVTLYSTPLTASYPLRLDVAIQALGNGITDAIIVAESGGLITVAVDFDESATLTDTLQKATGKELPETATLDDSITRLVEATRDLTESITLAGSLRNIGPAGVVGGEYVYMWVG